MVVVRRVAVEIASHVGAHACKRKGMGLYCRRFSVLELLEVVLEVLAAQGAKAGVDSIVSRLASIRGRVHVGLGSGQELCIRSDWSNVVRGWSGDESSIDTPVGRGGRDDDRERMGSSREWS